MADQKMIRLAQVAKKLNVGISTIAEHLAANGFKVRANPNTKITSEQNIMLEKYFENSMAVKQEAEEMTIGAAHGNIVIDKEKKVEEDEDVYVVAESASSPEKEETSQPESTKEEIVEKPQEEAETVEIISARPRGLKVVDKIDLDAPKKKETPQEEKIVETPPVQEEKVEQVEIPLKEEEKQPEAVVEEETTVVEEKIIEEEPKEKEVEVVKEEVTVQVEETPKEEISTKEVQVEAKDIVEEKVVEVEEKVVTQKEEPQPPVEAKTEEKEKEVAEVIQETTETPKVDTPEVVEHKEATKSEPAIEEEKVQEEEKVTASSEAEPNTEDSQSQETTEGGSIIEAKADKLQGLKVLGKIELPSKKKKTTKPVASSDEAKKDNKKRKRKRIRNPERSSNANNAGNNNNNNQNNNNRKEENKGENRDNNNRRRQPQGQGRDQQGGGANQSSQNNNNNNNQNNNNNNSNNNRGGRRGQTNRKKKEEISKKEIDQQFKKTKSLMSGGSSRGNEAKSKRQYRKEKRDNIAAAKQREILDRQKSENILKVTEFISASELATLMNVGVNDIISKCLSMGMFVSINQRLDAENIELIADEFGFGVEFTSAEEEVDVILEEEDKAEDLEERAPIVTIMGHVDHGKTSLLDYVREAKVAEGEAGGITQHIGAYSVNTESGRRIVFLDTPGHEAFTAMRARGAKVTDVVIIVVAADDSVMPQTIEAINHAQVAGVPIVIAINKVDKPNANPNKIKEELSNVNILVEDWGGKYQSYEISAKTGQGIEDLLEGVLLEADVLELKANPNKNAVGTVVEASLDKGRGYVTTLLVQSGTLKVGDILLAGQHHGRVKAMTDHRGKRMKKAGPATPVQILGFNGAPQAGDKLNVLDTEREAREIATKREQIIREQSIRATKRTTLSDLTKRLAVGNFQQLNIIVKGDVDGSVEALSDSLLKLSTDEVEVNIIHKAVGAISEGDILLASTSEGIVIGFQVRPTPSARKIAERENVEIRLYSVIYDAINDVKDAMEGLLAPDIEEEIVGNVEIREVFKISKVGTVAGCYVTEGYIKRNSKIRLIRDGIVIYGGESGGELQALKRFKDDVNEVRQGFECGVSMRNYNDIKVGDVLEVYEEKEVKRELK